MGRCSWFVFIEPVKGRLQFALFYALPMAIELVDSEAEARLDFCRESVGKSHCEPLPPRNLAGYLASDRYSLNEPLKNSIDREVMPAFVSGNLLCNPISRSLSVNFRSSYAGQGPNGEEFFFCQRSLAKCYFPELSGVQYPYG